MNYKQKLLIAAALIACGGNAFAADTADLKVIGKIVPAACTPTFASGGTVDFGRIDGSTLSAASYTSIGKKSIPYSVSCTSAMKIAFKMIDSRHASVSIPDGSQNVDQFFGLGTDGAAKIGWYGIQNTGVKTADGSPVDGIFRLSSGSAWGAMRSGAWISGNDAAQSFSYATTGTLVPVAARVFAGEFEVSPWIAPTSGLDLSHEINLDGLATLEVSYL